MSICKKVNHYFCDSSDDYDEDLLDTQDQNFDDPEVGGGPIGEKLAVAQDKEEHYLPKTESEKKEPNKK